MESEDFSCPNSACGKSFSHPLKAYNLNLESKEPYDACPFCLAEIESETCAPEEKLSLETKTSPLPEKESGHASSGCSHFFGYLGQRATKEEIPEECMLCENLIQCMLKTVTR